MHFIFFILKDISFLSNLGYKFYKRFLSSTSIDIETFLLTSIIFSVIYLGFVWAFLGKGQKRNTKRKPYEVEFCAQQTQEISLKEICNICSMNKNSHFHHCANSRQRKDNEKLK